VLHAVHTARSRLSPTGTL
jgi:polyphenol oxidase